MKVPEKVLERFWHELSWLSCSPARKRDLNEALEAALEQLREELEGDEAQRALYLAHVRFDRSTDKWNWKLRLLQAALNHVLGEESDRG